MTTDTLTLTGWLLACIAEDEAAAKAVPPLGYNVDMGGKRQDERFTFGRTLPSSADGMGNWSEHRDSPTTRAHFERWDPARVLAECEAKRQIVALHGGEHVCWQPDYPVDGDFGETSRSGDCATMRYLATVFADRPGYREMWRP